MVASGAPSYFLFCFVFCNDSQMLNRTVQLFMINVGLVCGNKRGFYRDALIVCLVTHRNMLSSVVCLLVL